MTPLVGAITAFGLLVVVPLAFSLSPEGALRRIRLLWLLTAVPAAVALLLPRGAVAALAVTPFAATTLMLAASGAVSAWRSRREPWSPAAATAAATPVVAAATLMAERAGVELAGFELGMLALTPPHMLYAGVVASLLAAALVAAEPTPSARAAGWAVPVGVVTVLVGYLVGDWLELVGTLVLTAAVWTLTWTAWAVAAGAARPARVLLAVGAVVGLGSMTLACVWAVGEATGLAHPDIPVMVATHGVGNAVGLALCGVLGWRVYLRTAAPVPEESSWR